MVNHVLHPSEVGVSCRRNAILPAFVVLQFVSSPIAEVERWIRHDEVGFQQRVLVIEEGIGGSRSKVGFQPTDGGVHVSHLPRSGVGFLSVDADFAQFLLVVLHELRTLHEHSTRTAAGVVNTSAVGLQHFNQRAHDATGCIEFASVLAFHRGELLQAVFIDATKNVFLVAGVEHLHVGEQIHHIAQTAFVEFGACIVAWQDAFQFGVLLLDEMECLVDDKTYLGRVRFVADVLPTGTLRNKEDAPFFCTLILVFVFRVGIFVGREFSKLRLELVADVFQEDQPQHHSLVF